MAVRIRSLLMAGPVVIALNTGTTVRISAGQISGELPEVEVADNAKVDKLRRQGVIAVEPVDGSSAEKKTAKKAAAEPADRDNKEDKENKENKTESDAGAPSRSAGSR